MTTDWSIAARESRQKRALRNQRRAIAFLVFVAMVLYLVAA